MDGDEDIDILAVARYQTQDENDILLLENIGDLDFEQHVISNDFRYAVSVVAVDVNEDGLLDIVTASYQNNLVTWWENMTELNFERHDLANTISGAFDVNFTDIDFDGDYDLLAAAYSDDELILWRSHGNYELHAPSEFNLLLPEDGTTVNTTGPTLVWEASYDPDDGEMADYLLIYSVNDPQFTDLDTIEVFGDTTYTFENETILARIKEDKYNNSETDELLPNEVTIYWIILAADDNTEGRWAEPNSGFSFYIDYQTSTIVGGVRNADNNNPIVNAALSLYESETNNFIASATSSQTGYYSMDGIGAGTYYLNATVEGYNETTVEDIVITAPDTYTVNVLMNSLGVGDADRNIIPGEFQINSVYPNPFNPEMNIDISLPQAGNLDLRLFNILGKEVAVIRNNDYLTAGIHSINFKAVNLSSGQYIIQVRFDEQLLQSRVTLVR